ncbi:sushi, von Willebrand factor type A, EGF and pentraxin domain-containing protein 1-like isoform X3 [Oscarella lobularis]|uniref:sushi, von Willebrand factor type A, EGF and pentraxin domain-containing protein 1-like isoform X3 n=1 Tax=Oscarella lobularis TaxID=121494 RepID=UPI0033131560
MLRVFFFVLIATGTAIGLSQVDDSQCHGLLDWTIVKPKAHLGDSPFNSQTVALNAVDGVVPGNGEFNKCAITKDYGTPEKKSLTIDLHRTYLISSIKTYLRQNHRAAWQNGLRVYVGPNNNTHEGNTQCGLAYTYQNENHGPVFNCSPPVRGRFVFLLKSNTRRFGVQVCEVAVKVVTFDRLPSLPNACSHHASLNTTVTYHCEEGYVADGGKATSTCLENGTWSQPSLNCRKQCPLPPPKPEELSFRGTWRNITALYACPYGKGPMHQLILCGEDGQWIENFEPCEVLFCPNVFLPLPPLTLSIEENENVIGSKRNYSCNDRCYKLHGKASQTCVYSLDRRHAVWSSEVPTCQKIECHLAPILSFATSTVDSTTCGGTATYKCVEGYEMVGSPNVTCSTNGQWVERPSCEPVSCPSPVKGSAQLQTNSSDFTYSTVIQFSCKSRVRVVVGSKTSQCLSNGTWSHEPPKCKRPFCIFKPRLLLNMVVEFEDNKNETKIYADGRKVKFSCKEGYELDGQQIVNCTSNGISIIGQWNSPFPTCKTKTCIRPRVPGNGTVIGEDFHYPNTIEFRCNQGYVLTPAPKSVWKCSENGKWKDNDKREAKFPTCEPVNCGEPLIVRNGEYIGKEFTFGKKITYECNPGFKRSAWVQSTCLYTGNWSLPPTQCSQIYCPYLSAPDNGRTEFSAGLSFGSVGTISCNPGHDITINNEKANVETVQLKCEQEGKQEEARGDWRGTLTSQSPTCQPKDCGPLPDIPNGKVAFIPNTFYPGKAHYSCDAGFQIAEGENEVRCCETNGIWEGIEPHCEHKCATKICPSYQLCKLINNEATCVCLQRDKCSSDYNPVCGDDGKNYNNECLMKVAGCLAGNPDISVAKRGDCKYGGVCLTEKPAPPERNPCRGFFTRYYYDYTRGECKSFQYGGCFEGRNSFVSRKKCEDTCKPDPCGLEKDPGLCSGREERWYYNSVTKRCERFEYTGCFGNENNFVNEAKCYERCGDYSKPTVITTLPPTTAPPSIEECCNHTLKGNKKICEESKYVVAAKIVRVVKSKEGFAKYEIKVTDVVKGKRKGELWDVTSLEICRVGKCSTILCPEFGVGHKFLVGGKAQRNKVIHLDRKDNYLKPFAKDKRDQLQRVCN